MGFKNGLHLIQIMEKKILKKYSELMHVAQKASVRKESIWLIHKAAKLKTKFDNYEMI